MVLSSLSIIKQAYRGLPETESSLSVSNIIDEEKKF